MFNTVGHLKMGCTTIVIKEIWENMKTISTFYITVVLLKTNLSNWLVAKLYANIFESACNAYSDDFRRFLECFKEIGFNLVTRAHGLGYGFVRS